MVKSYRILTGMLVILYITATVYAQEQSGRIYGTITSKRGEEFEGRIGWGDPEHETIWNHTFDGEYDFFEHDQDVYRRQRDRRRGRVGHLSVQFSVMFGHIVSIERRGSGSIILLKDGREFDVHGGDCGKELTILDWKLGKIVLEWHDLELVEFIDEPDDYTRDVEENGYPIFGSVLTQTDITFSGFILWDNDESLSTHILNGKYGRFDKEIPFSNIQSITPLNRRSSEITLWNGSQFVLSGTNDVNHGNRGLIIVDPYYGIVEVEWRDVEQVDFERKVNGSRYSDFKAGKPLFGTLTDEYGDEHTGFIRWDDDEHITTDFLNGDYDEIELKIEFSNIGEIRRRTRRSALVILKNGVELLLRDSNDVNYRNKGIVILKNADDPEGELFDWDEFEKVTFNP